MDAPLEKFHHYQVLKREDGKPWELGRGAMGITYKAFDTNLRCHVALKVVNFQRTNLDGDTAKIRFVREARAAASLRHTNVASVYHLGNDEECFFYAMEFIDGVTLEALVRRDGPLSCQTALYLTGQVAQALRAAARQELIHRDIKPANLMLVIDEDENTRTGPGETGIVKVIDFGLAKSTASLSDGQGSTVAAGMSGFVGTPQFASPEQLEAREVDTRSDIYSLGATLWYLLTGRPVFSGSFATVYAQHLQRPPPLEELTATPAPVRALLGRMLEKDPGDRPQTPTLLKKEIDDCMQALRAGGVNPREARRGAAPGAIPVGKTGSPTAAAVDVGIVLKARYRLDELVVENVAWRSYRAMDLTVNRSVACVVLSLALSNDAEMRRDLEDEAERILAAPHPNLLEVAAYGQDFGLAFFVIAWTPDFRPGHLVRRRRALPPREALWLAGHAAAAIDHARKQGIRRLKLDLEQTAFHFPAGLRQEKWLELLDQPLGVWPNFQLKLSALDLDSLVDKLSGGFAGETVVLPSRSLIYDTRISGGGSPNPLGLFICELLGGAMRPGTDKPFAYVPLSSLRETGNRLLRRGLLGEETFGSEEEFVRRLTDACAAESSGIQIGKARADGPPGTWSDPVMHQAASAASGPLIPPEFLGVAQAGAVLKLVPKPGASASTLPLHWVARRQVVFGRDREQADFITWFMPRNPENDQRTRRVGRAALRLEASEGRLWAHSISELNSVLANGQPVLIGKPQALALERSTLFLLNGEYACEALPIRGSGGEPAAIGNLSAWAGSGLPTVAAAIGVVEAVRLLPVGSQPAFQRVSWLLKQAAFGRLETNLFSLNDPAMGGTQGSFSYRHGAFWIESLLDNNAVSLEATALKPGAIAPLASGQTLRLGQSVFDVQVVS